MGLPGPPGEKGSTVRHNEQDREEGFKSGKGYHLRNMSLRVIFWVRCR